MVAALLPNGTSREMVRRCCTKDNSVTIVETVESLDLGFRMTVRGTDLETNAVAAYCQNDSIEFFIISNKEHLLEWPANVLDFEVGDFVYYKNLALGSNLDWAYGGQALGEDITGFPGILISSSDADISIDSNDGSIVAGSSNGTLLATDGQGNFSFFPYEMNFVAEIIAESSYCE